MKNNGIKYYFETSARNNTNVEETFKKAIYEVCELKEEITELVKPPYRCCCIV